MKSFACVVLLLTVIAASSLAAKCNVKGTVLSPGQTVRHPEAECAELQCLEDGATQYLGCPLPALAEGCKDEGYENLSLPYPDCCGRIITCVYS